MKATFARIFLFVLAVVGTYAYVGQLVPQFEEHPPARRLITTDTPPQELADIGEELLRGKGGCLICHKVTEQGNERGPDLRQATAQAATRRPGTDAEAYLMESLVAPDAFLVPGYPKMMPSALKPPANLNMAEAKAVVAYLQSLGGAEITVKVQAADIAAAKAAGPVHRGKELLAAHGCIGCHKVEGEGGEIGPELTGVAAIRAPEDLLRKIVDPSAWTTPNYPAGVMPAELGKSIPEGDRHEIVAFLAGLSGKPYSPTGAASPWSHEGVRLGLVILVFNLGMIIALLIAGRRAGQLGGLCGARPGHQQLPLQARARGADQGRRIALQAQLHGHEPQAQEHRLSRSLRRVAGRSFLPGPSLFFRGGRKRRLPAQPPSRTIKEIRPIRGSSPPAAASPAEGTPGHCRPGRSRCR
jgi:mono/diheme cytochrome c family protein